MDVWAYEAGATLSFVRLGKPVENAYIESFNWRFRDRCLNQHGFVPIHHTKRLIEICSNATLCRIRQARLATARPPRRADPLRRSTRRPRPAAHRKS
ncbi:MULTISPECIES: integrase core domain-containing protein [Burkholderia cepacia complex]|uniref:integrase core domain-containing protein n=1 Tax=Burkholderia cepacia complex TaxID=87882 RepID=UPI0012BAD9D1